MAVILTEEMILEKSKGSDLKNVKKLNFWGRDLKDVSILQHLPNVEILALSVNNICTLKYFQYCTHLKELYLRKNNITDISEILYLKGLPKLYSLWLEENPCAHYKNYRLMVLKVLPNLQKLDNTEVKQEEITKALSLGLQLDQSELNNEDYWYAYSENDIEKIDIAKTEFVEVTPESDFQSSSTEDHQNLLDTHYKTLSSLPVSPIIESCPIHNQNSQNSYNYQIIKNKNFPYNDVLNVSASTVMNTRNLCQQQKGIYPTRSRHKFSNVLSAALCLVKELDVASLEVLANAIKIRIDELDEDY